MKGKIRWNGRGGLRNHLATDRKEKKKKTNGKKGKVSVGKTNWGGVGLNRSKDFRMTGLQQAKLSSERSQTKKKEEGKGKIAKKERR